MHSSIQKNEIFPAIPKRAMVATFSRTRNYVKQYERRRKIEERERQEGRAMRCGIGILKNSKGPFPALAPGRRFTSNYPVPSPAPLTTEIDAGNAISSDSSAFIL